MFENFLNDFLAFVASKRVKVVEEQQFVPYFDWKWRNDFNGRTTGVQAQIAIFKS